MKISLLFAAACAVISNFLVISYADANFIGNTVTAEWSVLYPDILVIIETHDVLVDQDVELPSTVIMGDSRFDIDIGDNFILFSFNEGTTWGDDLFNGWEFSDTDGLIDEIDGFSIGAITGVVSGLEADDLSYTPDSVTVNFGRSGTNVSVSTGSTIRLDVSFVPITPALWLFGSGLLGLVGIARRKKAV